MKSKSMQKLTRMGMLAALSVALVAAVHFPLLPAAPYLEYDPSQVPILVATFLYGPWYGVAITAVVSVIQGVTVSAASGVVGIIMHFIATSAFCLVAGFIYRGGRTLRRAVVGLVAGALTMAAVMVPLNWLLTPLYSGMPRADVAALLLPVVLPFNLLKAGINSVLIFFVYKPVHRLFDRMSEKRETRESSVSDADRQNRD